MSHAPETETVVCTYMEQLGHYVEDQYSVQGHTVSRSERPSPRTTHIRKTTPSRGAGLAYKLRGTNTATVLLSRTSNFTNGSRMWLSLAGLAMYRALIAVTIMRMAWDASIVTDAIVETARPHM